MMLDYGRDRLKTIPSTVLPRIRFIRVEFNTGDECRTVFLRTKQRICQTNFVSAGRTGWSRKVNYQNTQVTPGFALTPLRSVAIISVSVRSAELRLELYV